MSRLTPPSRILLQIQLRLEDVKSVEKQNTAYVVPNAILLQTKDNKKVVHRLPIANERFDGVVADILPALFLVDAVVCCRVCMQYFFTSLMHRDQTFDVIQRQAFGSNNELKDERPAPSPSQQTRVEPAHPPLVSETLCF